MELFPVEFLVIHGADGDVVLLCRDLGGIRVDARGGRHIEALGGAEVFGIVDADEVAFRFIIEGGSGGAVGLIADDEIEIAEAVKVLGAADDIERMIGGEDDAHVVRVVALFHFLREALGIGGGGVAELVGEGLDDVFILVALFPDLGIRADCEGVERDVAFLGPLGEGLGKQVQAGYEEEHELVFPGDFLGDLEAGEGLARAAGHDELATVGGLQSGDDFALGAGLVRAEILLFLEDRRGAGLILRPVDLAGFEGGEVDLADGRRLVVEGVFRVFAPVIGGGDDVAEREGLLARGGEEAVDVGLFHRVVLGVALALDGVVFLGAAGLRDEVDAGVLTRETEFWAADFLDPVGIQPDMGIEIGIGGLVAEVGADEFLEVGAFFAFRHGIGAVGGENLLKWCERRTHRGNDAE